jgi:hypothetical protein
VRSTTNTVHVLLINNGNHDGRVSLQIPGVGSATAQRLVARSARATTGGTLRGQHLDAQGGWVGEPVSEAIPRDAGCYRVTVPAISAALVTATLNPGTLTASHR